MKFKHSVGNGMPQRRTEGGEMVFGFGVLLSKVRDEAGLSEAV